jgi:hypothetical protein
MKKAHHLRKKIGVVILSLVLIILTVAGALWHREFRSLMSLTKLDDYPLYRMTYYGDYGFRDFLKIGAESDRAIEKFVTERLLKGLPIDLGVTGDACTAFVVPNDRGEILFCRNFDFSYAPALQVNTKPKDGYQSVSTVNLAFAGYGEDKLPEGMNSFLTLASPFLSFDGMNEKGVAMALLAVPEYEYTPDPEKVTLNTTTVIRLVLDQAATVEEAVELLKEYNIYFSAKVECHYLIADASGRSVIVEYYDGKLQTVTSEQDYQIASNFIAYQGLNIGEGGTEFERYDTVENRIINNRGRLNEDQAIELLKEIGGYNEDGSDRLQWSVIYNLTTGEGKIFTRRNTENIQDFKLGRTQ